MSRKVKPPISNELVSGLKQGAREGLNNNVFKPYPRSPAYVNYERRVSP